MRYSLIRASVLVISLGCAFAAESQERTGAYIGASLGEATNESGEFRGSDTAFKLSAGYAFNEYLGLEVAYVDAGTAEDTLGLLRIENESAGVIASTLIRLPLGDQFALFGKVGYAFYKGEATVRVGDLVGRESESDQDFAYGLGIEVAVIAGFRARAEYEAIDVSDGDFDIFSVGFVYEF